MDFMADRLEELGACAPIEPVGRFQQRGGGAGDGGQRRAKVVRYRREEHATQPLGFHPQARRLRLVRQPAPFERQRGLSDEGVDVLARVGAIQLRTHDDDAEGARAADERHVQRAGIRDGLAAAAGRPPLRERPRGARALALVRRKGIVAGDGT